MKARILTALCLVCLFASTPGATHERLASDHFAERIVYRLYDLVTVSHRAQYADSLPWDRSFTAGMYPALVDFLYRSPAGFHPLIPDTRDGSGSSFMGLWFLSQSHEILGEIRSPHLVPLRWGIRSQIERARFLPQFFQGTSKDVLACPRESMGWYPLIDGYRLPGVLPDIVEVLLPAETKRELSNLSDGDIWAWCMAVDDTTPGILQYHHDIRAIDVYAPLLGQNLDWDRIHPDSQMLYRRVRDWPGPPRFPIGTFYGTSNEKKQRFSSVVMANILSSIPLLADVPDAYAQDIENTASFVRDAALMAFNGELTWEEFAYDYYTIDVAAIAYVARAHKRIVEIGRDGFPDLLDGAAIASAVSYISGEVEEKLANPNLYTPRGAKDYASLVYGFNAMMNLRFVDPILFDEDLVERTARALLIPNRASHTVPGTGPYAIIGDIIWADMASVCFVVPPLIEAFALYLGHLV